MTAGFGATEGNCAPWRLRLFHILEFNRTDRASRAYAVVMVVMVLASLTPLWFKDPPEDVAIGAWVIMCIFIVDYAARWMTADLRDRAHEPRAAFIRYPLTFWAIVDLLSILSFLLPAVTSIQLVRLLSLVRLLRVVELLRYSRSFYILLEALRRERFALASVAGIVVLYIIVVALVMYNCEPDMFETGLDAVYWSTTALATVGYGDLAPVTSVGRAINVISTFVGIGVVALPTGIITSAYVSTLNEVRERFRPEGTGESIIDRLVQRRADELGIDPADITQAELFGSGTHDGHAKTADTGEVPREDAQIAGGTVSGKHVQS